MLIGDCETHDLLKYNVQYIQFAYADHLRLINAAAVHNPPQDGG